MAAKKGSRKKASRKKDLSPVVSWAPDFDDIIESVSHSVGLTPVSLSRAGHVEHCTSTGLLAYDLVVGGGFAPGRFCGMYGPEAGGKSTACASSIAEAQKKGIQSFFFDHEGSADPGYWERIGIQLYSSFKDADAQEAASTEHGFKAGPNLMYYAPDSCEKTLRFMSRLMQKFPDKRLYEDEWYYLFNGMTQKAAKEKGIPFDLKLTKKLGGGVWVPAENGCAQAIIYIDSIAAMKPEALIGEKKEGEWTDESKIPALLASALSKGLKGITGLMVEKRFTIVVTNQFRVSPGVKWGDPGYAPGGNALAHSHDNRSKFTSRACPAGWTGKTSKIQEEACWDGAAEDRYTFSQLKSEKCKDFMPHKSCWVRWWFDKSGAPGPGIDPVFDTLQYLRMTGQWSRSGSKFEIELPGFEATMSWPEFKALVLDPANGDALRQACWEQLRTGDGFQRYFDTPQTGNP